MYNKTLILVSIIYKNMKTIKDMTSENINHKYNQGYKKALKDVKKLIDEMLEVCDDLMLRELKSRINGI